MRPPNFRRLVHEKTCNNCEHSQSAVIVGMWCEKHNNYKVHNDFICDTWAKQITEKKCYVTTPYFQTDEEQK